MAFFLSKFVPLFLYPAGFASLLFLLLIVLDLWQRKWNGRSWIALVGFLTLMLGGNFYFTHWISHSLESRYQPLTENPKADAIVMLGGGVRPELPPRQHPEIDDAGDRVYHGAFLYHKAYAPLVIVTGGWIPLYWDSGEDRSEAQDTSVLLEALDIPADKILLETRSTNTRENAINTAELLKQKGIEEVILVTSAAHMHRSVLTFQKAGINVIPAPTDYFVTGDPDSSNGNIISNFKLINLPPKALHLKITTDAMKEYVGLVYYRLRGWI